MNGKILRALGDIGSIYDFEPFRARRVSLQTPLQYLGDSFEYIIDGVKATSDEIETKHKEPEQLELLSTD